MIIAQYKKDCVAKIYYRRVNVLQQKDYENECLKLEIHNLKSQIKNNALKHKIEDIS